MKEVNVRNKPYWGTHGDASTFMSQRNRAADTALGLIIGLGLALLIVVWAVPGFRNPSAINQPVEAPGFWDVYTSPKDSYAQWIAAFSALISVLVSMWAVWLVRRTLSANTDAVDQARAANQIAQQTAERQLRAYMLAANSSLQIADNGDPIAHVRIQNFGQTPAFDVKSWIHIWVEAFPKVVDFPNPPDDLQMAKGIKGPGFHGTFRHRRELPLAAWELEEIAEQKAAIYVYGLIEYKDCFGNKRRTKFMRFFYGKYDPENRDNMHEYMDGNEAD